MGWVSWHGPYDDPEYGELHGQPRGVLETEHVRVLLTRDGRSGPFAPYGGWSVSEKLAASSSLARWMEALLDLDCTLRLGPPSLYPKPVWRALTAAATFVAVDKHDRVGLDVTSGAKVRKTRQQVVDQARNAGLQVTTAGPISTVQWLAVRKAESEYEFSYDPAGWARQSERYPDVFKTRAIVGSGNEPLAAILEARIPGAWLALAWHQSDKGRELGATDLLVADAIERCLDQFVDWPHGCYDLGLVERELGGLIRYKEGFGAQPYVTMDVDL
jgi:hypothetical protein